MFSEEEQIIHLKLAGFDARNPKSKNLGMAKGVPQFGT
jgi:hypothetical protein